MSRRRFGCQTGKKLRRTGTTKIRVFRELPETTLQQFQGLRKTKQEKLRRKNGDKSRMSRVIRGVEQHKARIFIDTVEVLTKTKQERLSETETSQQRAEPLEVLSKTKQNLRLRQR